MIFCKNPDSDVPILEIYDVIGQYTDDAGKVQGISGKEFADYLKFIESQEGKKRIDVYINSLGGSIIDGLTIYFAIKSCKIQVNTVCVGVAVSMGGIILQAGKVRQMSKSGLFMAHNPSGGDTKELQKLKGSLIQILCERTGLPEAEMSSLMDDTTWYDCNECLEKKIIDEIVDITSEANLPEIKKETAEAAYRKLSKIVNQLTTEPKTEPKIENKMKRVFNQLNLEDTATESEAVNSVKLIQKENDKLTKASKETIEALRSIVNEGEEAEDGEDEDYEDSVAGLKKCIKNLKGKMKKMGEDLAAKNKECEDAKKVSEDAKTANVKNEATLFVDKAIKEGKFKPEVKDTWVDMYVGNPEETKKLIEAMNSSRPAAKFGIEKSNLPEAKKEKREGEMKNISEVAATGKTLATIMKEKQEAFNKRQLANKKAQ